MADEQEGNLYSLGRPARDVYDELVKDRLGIIEKAQALAEISIPSLFPPDGYKPGDNLTPPNQSVNSRCINTLASKLMFVALPPGKPCLKFNVLEHKLQGEIDEDPELWTETQLALSRREEAHRLRLEATNVRSTYTLAMKYLLGGGNVLWQHTKIDRPIAHKMDTYVVKRNREGEQRIIILKETTKFMDLDGPDRQFVRLIQKQKQIDKSSASKWDEEVDIYTCQMLDQSDPDDPVWLYWQEYEGEMIPDSELEADFDSPPLFAAWLLPRFGHHWGGSYAEEYEGDMYIVENHQGALNDGAEAAALLLLFLKPGSATNKRSVEQAENGKLLTGDAADLSAFHLEKNGDFNFVDANLEKAIQRLSAAWLLMSSIQRDAERVTAEEWRQLASELDQAMGGLYSELAQGFQRHVVKRFLLLHEDSDKDIPELPKDIISVSVITGVDALGRNTEASNLVEATGILKNMLGEALPQYINPPDLITRIYTAYAVKPDGLVKKPEAVAQDTATAKSEAQQAMLLDKATGPVAKAGAEGLAQAALSQLAPPQQGAPANG